MKRFAFRLESLLNLRRAAEDQARRAWADARRAAAVQQAAVVELQTQERLARLEQAEAQKRPELSVAEMLGHQRYQVALARRAQSARARLAELELAATKARDALVEASRATKTLEKLREKKHAEWTREFLKQEQMAIEEVRGSSPLS